MGGSFFLGWRHLGRGDGGTQFERGRRVAERSGCFACHGPDGARGVATFSPKLDEVPTWDPATFSRFVKSRAELREWILDGMPARMKASAEERERVAAQLIKMPAYRGRLSESELSDLVSYVGSVSASDVPPEGSAARRGQTVALTVGCFGCHGPEGRGRMPNPGALKGYIPSWDSADYSELVESPEEFVQWVREGEPRRLRRNPMAAYFLDAQILKMPAYGDRLSTEEVNDLAAFVTWVRESAAAADVAASHSRTP